MAQPENATESIILTVSGTVVILSELQSLNAPNGIFLIAKEKVTSVRAAGERILLYAAVYIECESFLEIRAVEQERLVFVIEHSALVRAVVRVGGIYSDRRRASCEGVAGDDDICQILRYLYLLECTARKGPSFDSCDGIGDSYAFEFFARREAFRGYSLESFGNNRPCQLRAIPKCSEAYCFYG